MSLQGRIVQTLTASLLFSQAVMAQSTPRDVSLLQKAEKVFLADSTDTQVIDALFPILLDSCRQIANESGSASLFRLNSSEFQEGLRDAAKQLSAQLRSATSSSQKKTARELLLRKATDRRIAEQIVANWLGLENARTAGKANVTLEGALPVSDQLRANASGGGLTLDTDNTRLVKDSGGPGGGNGNIDGGEWIDLTLSLSNDTNKPWFSTSAVARSSHPCIFVPNNSERVLAEMAPGESTAVPATFYVSRNCPSATSSFQIEIRDTWRTQSGPQRLNVSVNAVPTGAYRLLVNRIDADNPGFSDGSGDRQLNPNRSYELSIGLQAAARFSQATMGIGLSAADTAFFKQLMLRPTLMANAGSGRFTPGDDIDVELNTAAKYMSTFRSRAADSRWVSFGDSERSYIWLAVDTVLAWEAREGEEARSTQTVESKKIPLETVLRWVGENTDLIPRPARPQASGAIEATDGYEVVFDQSEFGKAYRAWGATTEERVAAVSPVVLGYSYRSFVPIRIHSMEEVDGCTDSVARNFNPDATRDDGTCTYVMGCMDRKALNYDRNATRSDNSCRYPAGCMDPEASNYDRNALVSDNSCRYVRGCTDRHALNYDREAVRDDGSCDYPGPYVRLDGAVRFLPYSAVDPINVGSDTLTVWGYQLHMSISGKVRGSYGNRFRGMASLEFGGFPSSQFAPGTLVNGNRFAIEVGAGKPFSLIQEKLEIELMAKIGYETVGFQGQLQQGNPSTALGGQSQGGLNLGAELRMLYRLNPNLGLYGGASRETGDVVRATTSLGSVLMITEASKTGFEFGASYFF